MELPSLFLPIIQFHNGCLTGHVQEAIRKFVFGRFDSRIKGNLKKNRQGWTVLLHPHSS